MYYDADAGYLFSLSTKALTHETRASAWYASGLLARNEGDDVKQAVKIIRNVIDGQHKNISSQWYVIFTLFTHQ
jgi:cytochrome c-type biogenesis protein CcmH/NrfG